MIFLPLNCGPVGLVPVEVWNQAVTVRGSFPHGKFAVETERKVVADDDGTMLKADEGTSNRSAICVIPEGRVPNIVSSPGLDASKEKKNASDASFGRV